MLLLISDWTKPKIPEPNKSVGVEVETKDSSNSSVTKCTCKSNRTKHVDESIRCFEESLCVHTV